MLANGVLAGAEIAVVAMRKTRVDHLVQEGSRAARAIQRLHKDPERFFATVQIGITVVGATAGAFGGATLALDLEKVVQGVPLLAPYAEELSLAIVISLVSYLSLVLGELVPKSLALRGAERYALFIGRPLAALSWLTRPLVWFLTASSNAVLRVFQDSTTFTETRLSPEELQQLVGEAAEAGSVDRTAGEIASRAIDFSGLTAGQVMVPLHKVVALPRHASPVEVQRILLEQGHTRLPVYEGTIDHVVGYVTVRDLLALFWDRELIVLEDALRPAYFVPEKMRAVDLLTEMRRRRVQLAIVVDEHASMAGIVTLEDILEEIVGEIGSEHSEVEAEAIVKEPGGTALVRGDVPVRDVNRTLGLNLPESQEWSTIAGLCLELAGRIPARGDVVTAQDGTSLEVAEATPRQIQAVRIRAAAARVEEPGADDA